MTKSSQLTVIAIALAAATFAATPAFAQRSRGGGRGLPLPQGTGRLRNAAQGMCLDVAGWAGQGDSKVLLWECNDDPDHVWSFTRGGELRNTLNNTCLDAAGTDGQQGANVDVYRCESMDDQRWKLVPRGRGTFEMRNVKRGLCLDVNGRAGAKGDNVLLWACDGGADQLWSFEPYAAPPPRTIFQQVTAPQPVQQPAGPDPTALPRSRPMDEGNFRVLVGNVRNESFSDSQLAVVAQAATRNFFRITQVKALIDLVAFSATKLRVLELCAPHIVDRENAFALFDSFTFSADKEQARAILRRNGI
jgi:hypothetical protein